MMVPTDAVLKSVETGVIHGMIIFAWNILEHMLFFFLASKLFNSFQFQYV